MKPTMRVRALRVRAVRAVRVRAVTKVTLIYLVIKCVVMPPLTWS